MKAWLTIVRNLLTCGGVLLMGCAATGGNQAKTAPAIQAIQQASDPSAAVTAYANGIALDRTDPNLYEAYVAHMVDFGLPEMAYHQAQTLTTLQARNGLAWGVVAYVDARRGDMPEAVSATVLAGQFSPDNNFVQRTAGEVVAWYDLNADKSKLPGSAKEGVAKVRALVGQRSPFTEAYNAAKTAYQGQSNAASVAPARSEATPQAQMNAEAMPQAQTNYVTAPLTDSTTVDYPVNYAPYYAGAPGYYYDWGPTWIEPAPWWWWQPLGFFGGCDFFPFGSFVIFGDFDDFHHFHHSHHFDHDGLFGHDDHFGHNGAFDHHTHGASAFWHHDAEGGRSFFGTPTRPSPAVAQWTHQNFQTRSTAVARGTGAQWWTHATRSGGASRSLPATLAVGRSMLGGRRAPTAAARTQFAARAPTSAPAVGRHSTGTFRRYAAATPQTRWAAPTYHTRVYSAPRRTAPGRGAFGTYRGDTGGGGAPLHFAPHAYNGGGFSRGGFHGGSSFGVRSFGGGFHGGRSFGGGFHGGGFGGGSHGGGGRR